MQLLHVMKVFPYPAIDGYRSDILARLQSFQRLGYEIDLIVVGDKRDTQSTEYKKIQELVTDIRMVGKAPAMRSQLSRYPALIARNSTLKSIAIKKQYDVIMAESEHVMQIFDNPQLVTGRRVLRVHNNEAQYMSELSKSDSRIKWKLFFALEAMKYKYLPEKAYEKVDEFWFISKSEMEATIEVGKHKNKSVRWLPPSISSIQNHGIENRRNEYEVLLTGGLANPLNREGLRWYMKEVHPRLLSNREYRLVVAGNSKGLSEVRVLAEWIKLQPQCDIFLDLPSLDSAYSTACVIVNPMQRGSGVKLKTIHAAQQNIPQVTTYVGAEGSGLQDQIHLRIANTGEEFARAIMDLWENPEAATEMADHAKKYIEEFYNVDQNLQSLTEL